MPLRIYYRFFKGWNPMLIDLAIVGGVVWEKRFIENRLKLIG